MKGFFTQCLIIILIVILTSSSSYSLEFSDNLSPQLIVQLQLFKKKHSIELQKYVRTMYNLRENGEYQATFELGSKVIQETKDIKNSKLINSIALLTTESALEIGMPVDTLLKYLKYYQEAEGKFDNQGKSFIAQVLYQLVKRNNCKEVNDFIKGIFNMDRQIIPFILTTSFNQFVSDKSYKYTAIFMKCVYPDYRIQFLKSLEERLTIELKDSLGIDKIDEINLDSINQLSNLTPSVLKLVSLISLKNIISDNYRIAENLMLSHQKNITSIMLVLGYEYAINNQWENLQSFFQSIKGTEDEIGYSLGYICLESKNFSIVRKIVLSDPVKFDSLGFDLITNLISLQKYTEAEGIIVLYPVIFQKQGIDLIDKYVELKNYKSAERIIASDPQTFRNQKIQLALAYLKERQYSQAERMYLEEKDFLDYKNGLYLLITQINLYSYNTALDNFRKFFHIFSENSSNNEILWEKIARMFIGEIFPLELTEYISSITDMSERLQAMCIANYFIGLKFFSEGNKTTAMQYFSQAVSTDMKDLFEYTLATNMLESKVELNVDITGNRKTIAVLDFEANGLSEAEARIITNRLTANLTRRDAFIVLERAKMDEILKEQGFQQSGCVSNECVVEVGQLLGMELMLTGSVGRFGSINIIEARIIDVETGKILKSATFDIQGAKELLLTTGINGVLNQLLK